MEITLQVKETQGTSWCNGLMVQPAWPLPCVRHPRLVKLKTIALCNHWIVTLTEIFDIDANVWRPKQYGDMNSITIIIIFLMMQMFWLF